MATQRKYRKFTAQRKIEIVLAGLWGDRPIKDVCREHEISDALYYSWRDKLLEAGKGALAGKDDRQAELTDRVGRKRQAAEVHRELQAFWSPLLAASGQQQKAT